MKRATRKLVERARGNGPPQDDSPYTPAQEAAQDILDSDARQAAELRRLRKALRLVVRYMPAGFPVGDAVRAALKPARRKP